MRYTGNRNSHLSKIIIRIIAYEFVVKGFIIGTRVGLTIIWYYVLCDT